MTTNNIFHIITIDKDGKDTIYGIKTYEEAYKLATEIRNKNPGSLVEIEIINSTDVFCESMLIACYALISEIKHKKFKKSLQTAENIFLNLKDFTEGKYHDNK